MIKYEYYENKQTTIVFSVETFIAESMRLQGNCIWRIYQTKMNRVLLNPAIYHMNFRINTR